MIVPYRGVALAVEQFLIEAYGFQSRPANRNFDTNELFDRGWFNNRPPALTNRRRNFSAKYNRPLYCAAIRFGAYTINAFPPSLRNRFPPATRIWWPNFPARDCFSIGFLESTFFRWEGRAPANPRA